MVAQVEATVSAFTFVAEEEVVVIEVDELTESVDRQTMHIYWEQGSSSFEISYSTEVGELRTVLIAPPTDEEHPFVWSETADYHAVVDHETGDVQLALQRDGEYLVKTVRENGGVLNTSFLMVMLDSACSSKDPLEDMQAARTMYTRKPQGLVLISTSASDNGFLTNARRSIGSGNFTPISNVVDVTCALANNPEASTFSFVDHGHMACQGLGDGMGHEAGKHIDSTSGTLASRAAIGAACQNISIQSLWLMGCCVGRNAGGQAFLAMMDTVSACPVYGPNGKVYCRVDKTWSTEGGFSCSR